MAARAHSSDPRAERVRARLREAAFALAHEGPVDALTVGDIVGRAGVSRQVFYRHFRDRDDAVATAVYCRRSRRRPRHSGDARDAACACSTRRRAPVGVPEGGAQCGDATRRDRLPRRTATPMRGDRRAGHASGDHRRRPDPGGGDPIPRRRVHGGVAVMDGGPGLDRSAATVSARPWTPWTHCWA